MRFTMVLKSLKTDTYWYRWRHQKYLVVIRWKCHSMELWPLELSAVKSQKSNSEEYQYFEALFKRDYISRHFVDIVNVIIFREWSLYVLLMHLNWLPTWYQHCKIRYRLEFGRFHFPFHMDNRRSNFLKIGEDTFSEIWTRLTSSEFRFGDWIFNFEIQNLISLIPLESRLGT